VRVLFIAPFPPPITGQSLAARVFRDDLARVHDVASVNLSVGSLHDGTVSGRRIAEVGKVLLRVLRRLSNADIVYLTISETVAGNLKDLLIYLICARRLSRVYIHLHGGSMKEVVFDRHPILLWLNTLAIRRLGGVIITGRAHEQIFAGMVDPRRVHTVPNFAMDELFVSRDMIVRKFDKTYPLRVLYLSGMADSKGYLDLLDAYRGLGDAQRQLMRIDFAGRFATVAERDRFEAMTAALPGVRYHGIVEGDTKRQLLGEAHVFCLPTRMLEGQPISILEAYASGCVVVTTGQPGIRDIFTDGLNGTEVPQRSPSGLAVVLGQLAAGGPRLLPIALENRRLAEQCYRTGIYNAALRSIIEEADRTTSDAA
jgi:glycosyltransferase involved in cell wall biosynthesis